MDDDVMLVSTEAYFALGLTGGTITTKDPDILNTLKSTGGSNFTVEAWLQIYPHTDVAVDTRFTVAAYPGLWELGVGANGSI